MENGRTTPAVSGRLSAVGALLRAGGTELGCREWAHGQRHGRLKVGKAEREPVDLLAAEPPASGESERAGEGVTVDEEREVLGKGRQGQVLLFDPEVLDLLIEQGGARLVGLYAALCRLVGGPPQAIPAEGLKESEEVLRRKFGARKAELRRLIDVLQRAGLVERASGARVGP